MLYSLVVTLREGLEAALLLALFAGTLRRLGAAALLRPLYGGALAGLGLTVAGAWAALRLLEGVSGRWLDAYEGLFMLLGAALVTYLVIWVHRHVAERNAAIRHQIGAAVEAGSPWPLFLLALTAVAREGVETVLFLAAGASRAGIPWAYAAGGALGLAAAALAGLLVYKGALRLPLRAFFRATTWLVLAFAAGMIANGVKELQEAGWIAPGIPHVWDTYALLPDTGPVGRFLNALFGYDASPSLAQVLAVGLYLLGLALYAWLPARMPGRKRVAA